MRIIDRYLLGRLTLPFIVGLMLFVLILLAEVAYNISSTIVGGRVSAELIIRYLLLRTPRAIVWSLPFGTLLGVAMSVTTLAHYGEITAIRAGGVSFTRICVPLIVAGAVAAGGGLALNQYVVPSTMEAAQQALADMMMTQAVVREAHNQFFRDEQGRFFYVRDMLPAENTLREITIWTRNGEGRISQIMVAQSAHLQGTVWTLYDGARVVLDERGGLGADVEQFASREVYLTRALQQYYSEHRAPAEMAPYELQELIEVRKATGGSTQQLEVYLHFKYSIPVACFVFAIVAAPLGHRYARHGTYVGVVVSLLVVFLYNGVRSWTLAFGLAGSLDPVTAGWAPDALFGVLGMIFLAREG